MLEHVSAFLRLAPLLARRADEDDAGPSQVPQVAGGRGAALDVTAHDTEGHLHEEGGRASVAQASVGIDELHRLAAVDSRPALRRVLVQHPFHRDQMVDVIVEGRDNPGRAFRALGVRQGLQCLLPAGFQQLLARRAALPAYRARPRT